MAFTVIRGHDNAAAAAAAATAATAATTAAAAAGGKGRSNVFGNAFVSSPRAPAQFYTFCARFRFQPPPAQFLVIFGALL